VTAQLQIAFLDPPPAGFANQDAVRQSVLAAFYEWARHFDSTAGIYTVNVSYQPRMAPIVGANAAAIYGDTYLTVGSDPANGKPDVLTAFGLGVAARSGVAPTVPPLTLYSTITNLVNATGNILAPLEREFGHALGIRSFRGSALTGPFPTGTETTYDLSVRGTQAGKVAPSSTPLTFYGPNAQVAFGGPVPLSNADASNPINPDGNFIDPTRVAGFETGSTAAPGSTVLTPLQVALLRDAGLPALTDQELLEHDIATAVCRRVWPRGRQRRAGAANGGVSDCPLRADLNCGRVCGIGGVLRPLRHAAGCRLRPHGVPERVRPGGDGGRGRVRRGVAQPAPVRLLTGRAAERLCLKRRGARPAVGERQRHLLRHGGGAGGTHL